MNKPNLYGILARQREQALQVMNRPSFYPSLAQSIRQYLPKAKVYLFGSQFTSTARPDSDIDVLVFTDPGLPNQRRYEVMAKVAAKFPHVPLQLHLVGPDELTWYRRFIKDQWREL